ncbi:MAG: hypothetical protein Q4P07_07810 [Ornithinimicrobium sp.]|uniref:hypothetical protein n=1 Tax=Ornithinimicrobium sp. TaxID=1977084 RepID=UPI0026E10502|nr:hypothetical protein [Ornithinimicrobium sp.]MDO5740039.1 hypothetical protein [Ornithinimicrobium sp.]
MPAASPETANPQPSNRSRLRRSGRMLVRVGSVLLALSLVLTLVAGLATRSLLNNLSTNAYEVLDGRGTLDLDAGSVRSLYVIGGLVAPGEDVPTPVEDITCMVSGPDGPVPVTHLKDQGKKVGIDTALARLQIVGSFTTRASGPHTIDCTGLGVVVAPELNPVTALLRIGGLLLGSLGVFGGATLLLIGGILTLIVRHGVSDDDDDDEGYDDQDQPPEGGAKEWWDESPGSAPAPDSSDASLEPTEPQTASARSLVDVDTDDYVEVSQEELDALSEQEIADLVRSGALIFVDDDDQLVPLETPVDEDSREDTYR